MKYLYILLLEKIVSWYRYKLVGNDLNSNEHTKHFFGGAVVTYGLLIIRLNCILLKNFFIYLSENNWWVSNPKYTRIHLLRYSFTNGRVERFNNTWSPACCPRISIIFWVSFQRKLSEVWIFCEIIYKKHRNLDRMVIRNNLQRQRPKALALSDVFIFFWQTREQLYPRSQGELKHIHDWITQHFKILIYMIKRYA